MWNWFRGRRRHRLEAEPFPADWLEVVHRNCRHFARLDDFSRQRLLRNTRWFLAEHSISASVGFALTDEMRVTVAVHASLLGIGFDEPPYHSQTSVIIRPTTFQQQVRMDRPQFIAGGDEVEALGSARHGGLVVLSWEDVIRQCRDVFDGHNVVLHEFAHLLDMANADVDGVPPIEGEHEAKTWLDVTQTEFQRLRRHAQLQRQTLLDPYGATSPAEFFAVATETFFERPVEMRQLHEQLYELLATFYRQSPADWTE